jgi:hypothetical protein
VVVERPALRPVDTPLASLGAHDPLAWIRARRYKDYAYTQVFLPDAPFGCKSGQRQAGLWDIAAQARTKPRGAACNDLGVLPVASENGTLLGIFFLLVLIVGLAGTIALWFFVIRNAPPDGSDIGRHPDADKDD